MVCVIVFLLCCVFVCKCRFFENTCLSVLFEFVLLVCVVVVFVCVSAGCASAFCLWFIV